VVFSSNFHKVSNCKGGASLWHGLLTMCGTRSLRLLGCQTASGLPPVRTTLDNMEAVSPMKNKAKAIALGVLLSTVTVQAQEVSNPEQSALEEKMCAQTKCQYNLRVTLKQEDAKTYDRTFKVFPAVVQPFGVVVIAGQTIHFEADVVGGKLVNMVAVDTLSHPEKTITAKLEQSDDGGMLLVVNNPFANALKFSMGMMPLDQDKLLKTSSCPVVAGGKIFETWPFPIFQIVLGNGRLLDESDKLACVE
jgi:hypothetical protein